MLYMVLEDFKGNPVPVYRRFRDSGRMAPDGLRYVSSWVADDMQLCYQLMECEDPKLLDEWIEKWKDIVEFTVTPVITSDAAAQRIAPRL